MDNIERSFDNGCPLQSYGLPVRIRDRLAFVDVETTGLSPTENRIAEIGVVTVDGDRIERWTTLLRTPSRRELASATVPERSACNDAPAFRDIAAALAQRLSGRLLIAHNARFDHAFLRAEFDRVGAAFDPQVLCSVMLSRKLYPHLKHHDLDSLSEVHGLRAETRHRALPDADLVWQLWQAIGRGHGHGEDTVGKAIDALLAGPVLPPTLDPALIGRLPRSPGAYVFHGEHNHPLLVGAAGNLKLHVLNYFRLDQATDKALEYSHRISNITWRATRGMLGAQLHAAALDGGLFATDSAKRQTSAFTWHFSPDAVPSVRVLPLSDRRSRVVTESFGIFRTERVAGNALVRLAARQRLCHCLLGIASSAKRECPACPVDRPGDGCGDRINRKKQLMRVFNAFEPLRVRAWPHPGPIGIRERSDVHVVDRWHFLGTAQNESDLYALLENQSWAFDRRVHRLLNRTFATLQQSRIVDLTLYDRGPDCSASVPAGVDR